MREFAEYAPEAFNEYTQRFNYHLPSLWPFIALALCDEALALRLLEMPFLAEDRGDGLDGDVLDALFRLTDLDEGDLDQLLLHPLLEDGITEVERVFVLVLALEYEDPDAAATIRSVPWVQQLMREVALSANDFDASRSSLNPWILRTLVEMADLSPVSLRVFLELPWVREQGIQEEHWLTETLRSIESSIHVMAVIARHIAAKSDEGMASILRMPFMQTLEPDDEYVLDILWETSDAGHSWTDGEMPLRQLLSDPVLEGGITNDNLGEVALADLRVRNPDYSSELERLPWILDGVSPSEGSGIFALWRLEHLGADVYQSVVWEDWVADGLTEQESSAIHALEQTVIRERYIESAQQ